jgi:hypothetical protein
MSNNFDRQEVAETAWDFVWVDGERPPSPIPAEEAAVHVREFVEQSPVDWSDTPVDAIVHYLDDEEPEIPDVSVRVRNLEITAPCDEVLARQHYIERPSA